LTTVVELHDGRSAVLPYPGDKVFSWSIVYHL